MFLVVLCFSFSLFSFSCLFSCLPFQPGFWLFYVSMHRCSHHPGPVPASQTRRHSAIRQYFLLSVNPPSSEASPFLTSVLFSLALSWYSSNEVECVNFSVWLHLLNITYIRYNVYSTMSIKCFILLLTTDIPWTPVVCAGLCNNSLEQRLQLIVCSFWCPAWVAFSIQGNIEPDPRNAFYHHSRRLAEAR